MNRSARVFLWLCVLALAAFAAVTPERLVDKLTAKFLLVQDAECDITLDTSLQLMGCGGVNRQKGKLYYKAPDRVMAILDKERYYIRGNNIKKIDAQGKRFYIRLLHAPDFSVGFNPRLMDHNFHLRVISSTTKEVVLEGLPKPGVLKNVKKVTFRADPSAELLKSMDLAIANNLKGQVFIDYRVIEGLDVPVACHGRSALELNGGFLVGLVFSLKGDNFKINTGLPDKLFAAGF
ncbi:MAG: hypothetical protein WC529_03760 [Candidatus Margulisiibacteriota bacterium]